MRKFILDFPKQILKGIEVAETASIKIEGEFDNLVVCGMGGSALPAEIIKTLPYFKLPVFIHRNYGLPRETTAKSLIFISSYSGNTEEALDGFYEAQKKNLKIIGFSVGGKLENLCREHKIFHIKYPKEEEGFQPRFAVGYSIAAMMQVLYSLELIPHEIKQKLIELESGLNKKMKSFEGGGKLLSKKVYKKIPLIYAPHDLKFLSYIWKINFNETSKAPAFANCFPEMNHNEINGFMNVSKIAKDKIHILDLRDLDTDKRLIARAKITSGLLLKQGIKTSEVKIQGENFLDKIFSSILLAMWTSYELALLYKTNPMTVKMVEDLKKKLEK